MSEPRKFLHAAGVPAKRINLKISDSTEAMESGMVAFNKGVISDPAAPFGSVNQSGMGREDGFDRSHEFFQTKYIGVEI